MPQGVYERTEFHRKRIGEGLRGKTRQPLTDEHKEKIRKANTIQQKRPCRSSGLEAQGLG